MMKQSFRLRQSANSGQAMAGQANDKIPMSQKEVNGEQPFDAGCEK
jgi:hypothetical protein